ncbi:MAG: hypothetical protein AAB869_03145, partial [Patescibacteria group bacterium]
PESFDFSPAQAPINTPESKESLSFPERFPEFVGYFKKDDDSIFSLNDFDCLSDRDQFNQRWNLYSDKKSREEILGARRIWVAMKSQGEGFVNILESWVRQSLEHALRN